MLCYSTTVICKISDLQMAKTYFILRYARYCTIVIYTLLCTIVICKISDLQMAKTSFIPCSSGKVFSIVLVEC